MHGQPGPARGPSGTASLAFVIAVQNASGTTLALQTATLSAGTWVPPAPVAGSGVFPGEAPRYVNVPVGPFSGLGGSLVFVPMTGGSITVGWVWPAGGMPEAAAYAQNTAIAVNGVLINLGSAQPTYQVTIGLS